MCKDEDSSRLPSPALTLCAVGPEVKGQQSTVADDVMGLQQWSCAYCCVLYGENPEYILLLLVLAHRLTSLGAQYPLLVLPTKDVPAQACSALKHAGCHLLPPVEYLAGHPALFMEAQGRHRHVFTKLRVLGLTNIKKVLLIDADILPRQSLDPLFDLEPPAAMMMPTNLEWVTPPAPVSTVPEHWLKVDDISGRGARFNCGVCLLAPDPELLAEIEKEVDCTRCLSIEENGVVRNIFGHAWHPSWTPEEDLLTRALVTRGAKLTHIGCAFNFEVKGDLEYYEGLPIAQDHATLDFARDAVAFHFVGQDKPSWYACFVGLGQQSVHDVQESIRAEYAAEDPREITVTAFEEWFNAFEELATCASSNWGLDLTAVCGWRSPSVLNGSYSDSFGGGTMTISHIGVAVLVTNPKQRWSPAKGSIEGRTIFMFGISGTWADGVITWTNGATWTLQAVNDVPRENSYISPCCMLDVEYAADHVLRKEIDTDFVIEPKHDPSSCKCKLDVACTNKAVCHEGHATSCIAEQPIHGVSSPLVAACPDHEQQLRKRAKLDQRDLMST